MKFEDIIKTAYIWKSVLEEDDMPKLFGTSQDECLEILLNTGDNWRQRRKDQRVNYREYIKSPAWREKSEQAKIRAGYRCQVCNGDGKLDTHHRTYDNLGNETEADLIVLCRGCHELFSKQGKLAHSPR